MVGTIQKLIKPTGFEAELEKAKQDQAASDNLFDGVGKTDPLGSWTQVLAAIMRGYAAKRMANKADEENADVQTKIKAAFDAAHSGLQTDLKTMTPEQIVGKYGGNQYVADDPLFKATSDAYVAGLKKRAEEQNTIVHTPTGFRNLSDVVGKPELNPEAKLVPGADGRFHINTPLIGADLLAQGFKGPGLENLTLPGDPSQIGGAAPTPPSPQAVPPTGMPFTPANIGAVESRNRDFNADGSPVTSRAGAMYGMQVLPSTAARPGYGVPPVPADIMSLPNTDPRKAAAFDQLGALYAQAMQKRFGALGPAAYNAGPGSVERAGGNLSALPQETRSYAAQFAPPSMPATSNRSPDGTTKDGKPFWLVNGVPFDNPQGN